ncbi:MAG TPA: hypothetical protein VHK01_00900 [Lacipirellulaceae bacterium]|jgi:hypothetical protein|nr:hypothetical protein [Lacipirellulaceae bacterium]
MIGYAKNDAEMREEFVRIARAHFDADFSLNEYFDDGRSPNKYAESAKLHLFSRKLRDMIHDCYCPRGPGRGALYKMIPHKILFSGSRECLLGLLCGILEGDSCLGWGRSKKRPQSVCRTNSSSNCLVKGLQRLSRLLGIRISITTNPPRGRSNESYSVNWSLPDIVLVMPELNFVSQPARQWKTEFLQFPPVKDDIDIVPIASALAMHFGRLLLRRKEMTPYGTCRDALRHHSMTRRAAKRILQVTQGDTALRQLRSSFQRIVDCDAIHWDRIRVVRPTSTSELFGLVVPSATGFMIETGLIIPTEAASIANTQAMSHRL